jgi:hypothetical protein
MAFLRRRWILLMREVVSLLCNIIKPHGIRPQILLVQNDPARLDFFNRYGINSCMMKRTIWASTRRQIIHGSRRLTSECPEIIAVLGADAKGVASTCAEVDLETALRAFDQVADDPGSFVLSTAGGADIVFMFASRFYETIRRLIFRRREPSFVTLDLWSVDDAEPDFEDVHAISRAHARELIERAYMDAPDRDLWNFLKHCG